MANGLVETTQAIEPKSNVTPLDKNPNVAAVTSPVVPAAELKQGSPVDTGAASAPVTAPAEQAPPVAETITQASATGILEDFGINASDENLAQFRDFLKSQLDATGPIGPQKFLQEFKQKFAALKGVDQLNDDDLMAGLRNLLGHLTGGQIDEATPLDQLISKLLNKLPQLTEAPKALSPQKQIEALGQEVQQLQKIVASLSGPETKRSLLHKLTPSEETIFVVYLLIMAFNALATTAAEETKK